MILINFLLKVRGSLNKPHSFDYINTIPVGEYVPRIVHQTYYTKDLPEDIEDNLLQLKENNPEWEFKFYDDDDIEKYILSRAPDLFKIYKQINTNYGAAKADFFRYLVIYFEGGIYLDIKAGTSKKLSDIIKPADKYILSYWPRSYPKDMQGMHKGISDPNGEFQQWYIISIKGHPFLKATIDNVCHNIQNYNPFFHDFGAWGVFNLTGPIAYSEAIFPIRNNHPHRIEKDHLELGLIYCAIKPEMKLTGHQSIFKKKHYSKLEQPVTNTNMIVRLLFYVCRPVIKCLKSYLKKKM